MYSKEKIELLKELGKTHTVKEIARLTGMSENAIYRLARKYGFQCYKKHKTLTEKDVEKIKELSKTMGKCAIKELLFPTIPYQVYKKVLEENDIVCVKKWRARDKKTGRHPCRIQLDEEHLKAHAHEYTLMGYYHTFNPPCARNTLRNRAIELGVRFKKLY